MQRQHWKRALVSAIASLITVSGLNMSPVTFCVQAQDANSVISVPAGLQESLQLDSTPIQYLPFAHFAIPFDVDRGGRLPSEVHLWVSPDQGKSWLKYATNSPDKRSFEFHAAAEGEYLFAVQTRDDRGVSALAAAPPMRVMVDTSHPRLELSADINGVGRLVIDYRIQEKYLSEDDVRLSYSIDGRGQWEEVRVGTLTRSGDIWSGRLEMEMPRCRELELKLTARDLAQNTGEVSARYNTPRTAAAATGLQLASQRAQQKSQTLGEPKTTGLEATGSKVTGPAQRSASGLTATDGAVAWEPSDARQSSVALRGTELSAIAATTSSTS
ncbi:MAG: hypothetical protein IT423_14705, partial [Pirellulaceae bacterium]|nr:hypothetical protein [Pirellulaceae bacterium]